jgi:hypothetical protein
MKGQKRHKEVSVKLLKKREHYMLSIPEIACIFSWSQKQTSGAFQLSKFITIAWKKNPYKNHQENSVKI